MDKLWPVARKVLVDHPVEADHECLLLNDVASHPLKYILLKMEIKFRNLERERGGREKGGREEEGERNKGKKEKRGKIKEEIAIKYMATL